MALLVTCCSNSVLFSYMYTRTCLLLFLFLLPKRCVKKVSSTTEIEKRDAKTIWIFTNQDNPIPSSLSSSREKELLITVARDVIDNEQDIKIWPLPNKQGKRFNRDVFYNEIIIQDDDNDAFGSGKAHFEDGTPVNSESYYDSQQDSCCRPHLKTTHLDLESLLEEIGRRWKSIRKSYSIPMLLPDWNISGCDDANDYPGIMIDLYPNVRPKRKPNAITIDSRTNK